MAFPIQYQHFSVLLDPSTHQLSKDPTGKMGPMMYPKSQLPPAATLKLYDNELQEWYSRLPQSCLHQFSTVTEPRKPRISSFHASILNMLFYAVVSSLHRPVLNQTASDDCHCQDKQLSHRRVCEAAFELSKITATFMTCTSTVSFLGR
ncbi:hypothetical protein EDD36DRAFT_109674 [Exophiala viscosa]|uniref:Transcription factor domain-containing protein n=1 Tax=Exophiala viscosa TaxID=2486360 RepID=A0AAN6DNC7_9EURO|nr:hypothetical protein EDD36DRAFT_109674 [Exophiala viscosa]